MAPIQQKRLEGVTATPTLWSLYEECLALSHQQKGEETATSKPELTCVSTTTEDSSESPKSPTNAVASLIHPLSLEAARTTVVDFSSSSSSSEEKKKQEKPKVFPISLIRAMKVVLENHAITTTSDDDSNNNATTTTTATTATTAKLEQALAETQLAFTAPPPTTQQQANNASLSPAQKKFRDRMERLKLQNEESKYYAITKNIGNAPVTDDYITTKSMTYAASVGLNMIVAPLSFGVFMYFFSGPLLNFLFDAYEPTHKGAVDIRKVIIGVLSGVAMLFIEMILFVIRTHELEGALRKKQKKMACGPGGRTTTIKPFGEYSSKSKKSYNKSE